MRKLEKTEKFLVVSHYCTQKNGFMVHKDPFRKQLLSNFQITFLTFLMVLHYKVNFITVSLNAKVTIDLPTPSVNSKRNNVIFKNFARTLVTIFHQKCLLIPLDKGMK